MCYIITGHAGIDTEEKWMYINIPILLTQAWGFIGFSLYIPVFCNPLLGQRPKQ